MKIKEPVRTLSPDEMQMIHENALRILGEVGVWFEADQAMDYLEAGGCRVDRDSRIATFPADVVNRWIEKMRADFAEPDRRPEKMSVRYSHVRFRKAPFHVYQDFSVNTGGFCVFICDLNGNKRYATLEDVRKCINLAHHLDQITYMGLPVAAQDVPLELRPVKMAAELVKRTDKLGGVEAFTKQDVHYITEIAEIVAGGKKELRENPVLVGYGEMRSPLCLDANMTEVMIEYIKLGLPQSLDTMPNAGATAPVTAAGALSLGIAETLAGLVLGYCVDANAVMTIDVTPSFMDMSSGLYRYFSAERAPLLAARIQMISAFYGCPSGVHGGKTDSCRFDEQTGMDKAISMLMPVLSGACGFGTVGHVENAVTFSPVQLVIDNEIARYVRHLINGMDVSADALAFDEIRRIGPGGEFLTSEHTLTHFRDEQFISDLFDHQPWDTAHAGKDIVEKAAARAEELMNRNPSPVLSQEQEQAIGEVVKKAEAAGRP
jgi:trimethylamine---corrinoid protein Co-methyltransferase